MEYEVVYDIRTSTHFTTSLVMVVVLFLVAILLFGVNQWRYSRGLPALPDRSGKPAPWLPIPFGIIGIFLFCLYLSYEYPRYKIASKVLKEALEQGRCRVSEGIIRNFMTVRTGSRNMTEIDSFDIGDSHFSFSDGEDRPGYKATAANHGPLGDGLNVRIFEYLGEIARVEVLKGSQVNPVDNSAAVLEILKNMKARRNEESPHPVGD